MRPPRLLLRVLFVSTAAAVLVLSGSSSHAVEIRGNFDQNGQYAELMLPANEQAARQTQTIPPELRLAEYQRASPAPSCATVTC